MQYIESVTWNQLKQPKLMIHKANLVYKYTRLFIKSLWVYYAWTYKDFNQLLVHQSVYCDRTLKN